MSSFASQIIQYNQSLAFNGKLPKGVYIMNPYIENERALQISSSFYQKYYNDSLSRHLILGINPGRLGAGITGIPFTDTKRLEQYCHLPFDNSHSHEPSSVFIYDMIETYGGPDAFYQKFYINSVCPLGFVSHNGKGNEVNCNYYDDTNLEKAVTPFIINNIKTLLRFPILTDKVFVLGTGKNFNFFQKLNQKHKFFSLVIPLEHPRYIMQYKSQTQTHYIEKYLKYFQTISSIQ